MLSVTDQLGHKIELKHSAKRIISVVPSQTEFLFDLGLDKRVVGITKFCIHPKNWHQSKTRVGGTKTLNLEVIQSLKPDLIIANKEENTQSEIEQLQKHFPVYISDIYNLEDVKKMMLDIGVLTEKKTKASEIISEVENNFQNLPKFELSALYLIWKDPFMAAGQKTFINWMLTQIGLTNVISHPESRYVELNDKDLELHQPQIILLSSEPYPFKAKHLAEIESMSNAKVKLVDGEMFSWYGSRLKYFKSYISQLNL
ncbi:MAG: ABC transporter substrate-binding protein [Putridiphycobacter sp.]